MEIDWGPKHNNPYTLQQLNTSHDYILNKFIHHHETNNLGLSLKEIDWGPKLLNMSTNKSTGESTTPVYIPMTLKRKSSFILWIMGRKTRTP